MAPPNVVGKGSCEHKAPKFICKGAPCLMLETTHCSASTFLDSSIVFISHLQSVLCFTLASYSYNCCVAWLQPEGTLLFFSSSELDAALVVMANIECTVYSTTKTLSH